MATSSFGKTVVVNTKYGRKAMQSMLSLEQGKAKIFHASKTTLIKHATKDDIVKFMEARKK